ncbi:unnamed protein product [Ascophyllum nodosum]
MKFLYALRREVFALHARCPQNLLRSPTAIPPSVRDQQGRSSLLRHGQGCGSNCGCVMDLQQVSVDREGNVTDATFAAKRFLLGAGGAPMTSPSGKLLLCDCPCETIRSLGSIATSECKGQSLESLRNRLLFSPAAPPSFWRSLMRKVGAPVAASACAQVAEAALTTALTDHPYARINLHARRSGPRHSLTTSRRGSGAGLGANDIPYDDDDDDFVEDVEEDGLAEVDFRNQYDDFA